MLTEELAWEWIMSDLSEERIKEIAAYQIPSGALSAYTIQKKFKTALDPLEAFSYDGLPAVKLAS